jgi:Rrf2 family protein
VISQTTEYALRAVVWLAANPAQPLTAHQIAEATRVPEGYLAKILQGLSRAGMLRARRGLGGGFTLAQSPSTLSMWDVVQAVDPRRRIDQCPLGFEVHAAKLCPLHRELDRGIALIEKAFSARKISQLMGGAGAAPLCVYTPQGKAAPVRGARRAARAPSRRARSSS